MLRAAAEQFGSKAEEEIAHGKKTKIIHVKFLEPLTISVNHLFSMANMTNFILTFSRKRNFRGSSKSNDGKYDR